LFDELPYLGGAFRMAWAIPWLVSVSGRAGEERERTGPSRMDTVMRHRPLATMDDAFGRPMRLYKEWLAHPVLDDYWKRIQFDAPDFAKIEIPALTVTGWFDGATATSSAPSIIGTG
jgi:predicted acyl esterase